jgi:hypothetical protein
MVAYRACTVKHGRFRASADAAPKRTNRICLWIVGIKIWHSPAKAYTLSCDEGQTTKAPQPFVVWPSSFVRQNRMRCSVIVYYAPLEATGAGGAAWTPGVPGSSSIDSRARQQAAKWPPP